MPNIYLNEFADLYPIGLKYYGTIGGEELHSNEKVVSFVSNWISKSPITKQISNKIIEGLENKKIIIGYKETSKLNFLYNRWKHFRSPTKGGYTLGFYVHDDQKLAIILDQNISLLGKAIREIPAIISHELIHMAAHKNNKSFLNSTMRSFLFPFYKSICNHISTKTNDIPNSELEKSIIKLGSVFDQYIMKPTVHTAANIWESYFGQIESNYDKLKKMVLKMCLPYLVYIVDAAKSENKKLGKEMAFIFFDAYNDIGVRNARKITTPGQEALYPSEILCISNQFKIGPTMVKLINNIDMRGN